jgi:hypothetical protein
MKVRTTLVVICVIAGIGVAVAEAQLGDCYVDNGNICLAQCGIFAQTGQDLALPNSGAGPYTVTALYPDCTSTCTGHAIGIDHEKYNGDPCYNQEVLKDSQVESLRRVAPGAPIFAASCSGNLVQTDLPLPSKSAKTIVSSRDLKNQLRQELGKEF